MKIKNKIQILKIHCITVQCHVPQTFYFFVRVFSETLDFLFFTHFNFDKAKLSAFWFFQRRIDQTCFNFWKWDIALSLWSTCSVLYDLMWMWSNFEFTFTWMWANFEILTHCFYSVWLTIFIGEQDLLVRFWVFGKNW